jgi:FkbM family methyltransferase
MNKIVRLVRKAVRARGYDMVHYVPWKNLFAHCGIDLILDVGANIGQTYESFRWAGFEGPIYSFEPHPEVFKRLQSQPGHSWQRFQYALSSQTGQAKFHVTNYDVANSLHKPVMDGLNVVGEISVQTYRLDELWTKQGFTAKRVFLKIDAEGHDLEVIKGASGILDRIQLIMVETGALPRFQGEPSLPEMVNFMDGLGFGICRAEKNSFNFNAGMDTAFDFIFARRELLTHVQL